MIILSYDDDGHTMMIILSYDDDGHKMMVILSYDDDGHTMMIILSYNLAEWLVVRVKHRVVRMAALLCINIISIAMHCLKVKAWPPCYASTLFNAITTVCKWKDGHWCEKSESDDLCEKKWKLKLAWKVKVGVKKWKWELVGKVKVETVVKSESGCEKWKW